MANSYIRIVDGEYKKTGAPGVPQPWEPKPQEIPEPIQELPDFPSEAGAYILTCTVADGKATLSWESAE